MFSLDTKTSNRLSWKKLSDGVRIDNRFLQYCSLVPRLSNQHCNWTILGSLSGQAY